MTKRSCCDTSDATEQNGGHETICIEKPTNSCQLCEDYSGRLATKPVAVICCEGSCLRGEVARQAANILCYSLAPERTARVCLGGAFTKNTGQRSLVREADRVLAVEGCLINCSSRMMKGVIEGLDPTVIVADRLYDFDRMLFGIDEMPEDEIRAHAKTVAGKLAAAL